MTSSEPGTAGSARRALTRRRHGPFPTGSSGGKRKVFLAFSVWPDSFDYYRRLRAALLARGYEVGWSPQSSHILSYTRLTGSGMDRPQ